MPLYFTSSHKTGQIVLSLKVISCDSLANIFQLAVSWGGHESLQIPTCVFYDLHPDEVPRLPFSFVRYYVGLEEADFLIEFIAIRISSR